MSDILPESAAPASAEEDIFGKLVRAMKSALVDDTPKSQVKETGGNNSPKIPANFFLTPKLANPERMSSIAAVSNALRPMLDAMALNIHSAGVRVEEKVPLDAKDADRVIAEQILLERAYEADLPGADDLVVTVTPEDIEAKKAELRVNSILELARIQRFLATACLESAPSFAIHSSRTAFDREGCGQSAWEVIRRPLDKRHSERGALARLNHISGGTVLLRQRDEQETMVITHEPISMFKTVPVMEGRRFRIYGHRVNGNTTYFKSFNDPRRVSQREGHLLDTPCWICAEIPPDPGSGCKNCKGGMWSGGKWIPGVWSPPESRKQKPEDLLANELYFWRVWTPNDEYGIPRWLGSLWDVLGSMEASWLNYDWFRKGTFNLSVLLAWGLNVGQAGLDKINADFRAQRGGEKQGAFLGIEAQPPTGQDPTKMGLQIVPLDKGRGNDALYQGYDSNVRDRVGEQFRLSPTVRGQTKNAPRATVVGDLQTAEKQVWGPCRDEFDQAMNGDFLHEMGVRYHKIVSNPPDLTDPDVLARTLALMVTANIYTVEEAREMAGPVAGKKLAVLHAAWTNEPNNLLLAKLQNLGNLLQAGYTIEQAAGAIEGIISGNDSWMSKVQHPDSAPENPPAPAATTTAPTGGFP